ncbi:extracellular solute-binding protein [Szabonella alba]|uniref:ABC transporter substrate-binding protein n=1 Tax=Szabonella alba TaxID=2804194 RepID=A0A8K0VCA4_9RHOB|nr:ABC transporter substrate-binding protein [Szabonella alba]
MRQVFFASRRMAVAVILWGCAAIPGLGEPAHGIAMYGDPALLPDFVALPYVNPDAPKGGRIVLGETGGFDSLNPFSIRGRPPWAQSPLTVETLLGRTADEPFTLYGLLAESVETDPARSFVEFTLRAEARFSDGSPVTVDDVLWSFTALGTEGSPPNPRYSGSWAKIAKSEITGPRSIRFTFNTPDRELPLILGLRPVLKQADWEGRDISASSMRAPIGSGPYVVGDFEAGRFVSFIRVPDWWGRDLPFNRGRHNLDEIRYDFYGDAGVIFEAFKGGAVTSFRETNAARWRDQYDFPAVQSGAVVQSEIPHRRPSGIEGLVMNTRRAPFDDWRVREALILAFNFELINTTLTGGLQPRIRSYFSNSELGMIEGTPAEGRVADLLAPFADDLLPGVIDGYALPVSDGTQANRRHMRAAIALLAEAGWEPGADGRMRNAEGEPFDFEILLTNGASETIAIASIYREALARLGIAARIATVDSAQMKQRSDHYDFDMTTILRQMSLSPGNEQILYWGAQGGKAPGSRNLMGMDVPAAEAMIAAMLAAQTQDEFTAATRALDRILTAGRYVIPFSYATVGRLAHVKELKFPERIPVYGDWPGFQPDVWWYEQ